MSVAYLPFHVYASRAVTERHGADVRRIALKALRTVIGSTRQLEVAHQQIAFGTDQIAVSTRIGTEGHLVVELDIGDPRLADRVILEADLQSATMARRGNGRLRYQMPRRS